MSAMEDLMNEFDMEIKLQASKTQHEQIEDLMLDGDQMMEMYDEDDEDNTDKTHEIQCVQAEPLATRTEYDIKGSLEGMRAGSWEELEQLYHDHARATGYSVRKYTIRKTNGVVHERYFVCSKQGTTEIKTKETDKQSSKRKLVPTNRDII